MSVENDFSHFVSTEGPCIVGAGVFIVAAGTVIYYGLRRSLQAGRAQYAARAGDPLPTSGKIQFRSTLCDENGDRYDSRPVPEADTPPVNNEERARAENLTQVAVVAHRVIKGW